MAEIIKMGSLYIDGAPAECGVSIGKQILDIGDTCIGQELSWVKTTRLLVADHTICVDVSWETLDKFRFVFGRLISIDGNPYLCRSLKIGSKSNTFNEWDSILDATSDDDALWHWEGSYFWGQETAQTAPRNRVLRGYESARYWTNYYPEAESWIVGFRPVLETLIPGVAIPSSMRGEPIKVYGPDGSISGILSEASNYDLFVYPAPNSAPVPDYDWCSRQKNGIVVINRLSVACRQGN